MINLYWKTRGQTRSLVEKPFPSEAELERYILDNQEILGGDIYVIHRQIRTGSKQGIPDMLGVDQDSRVCIIEIKNEEAGEDILPQALWICNLGGNKSRLHKGDLAREREEA